MTQKSLVDRIAEGEAILLGVDDICKRLGVSRATLDRWIRNSGGPSIRHPVLADMVGGSAAARALGDFASTDSTTFPPPDIRIGNSPKWEMETFKTWLRSNLTNPDND